MARFARVVAVGVPHHIRQRGNNRQCVLDSDGDRSLYLALLQENAELHSLTVMGYALMSNHVHLIATPRRASSMALALKDAHGRYASQWNVRHRCSGTRGKGGFIPAPWTSRTCGGRCGVRN